MGISEYDFVGVIIAIMLCYSFETGSRKLMGVIGIVLLMIVWYDNREKGY